MELWQRLGELHPKLVQFPMVLLLIGLLFDLAGLATRSTQAHWAGKRLTVLGTVGLLFAFICGIYAEIWAGRAGVPQEPIELHELMANLASWGFVVLMAWRLFLHPDRRRAMTAYVTLGLGWYLLLAGTAYLGGHLVFEYGAAVTGARANTVLSAEDLNTLAVRQTDENLRYSEWMHHIFGWMTAGLAASLLAQAIWPKHARKLKWIVPAFLLAGGTFLLFAADLDLYALTDMRQWASREVQLHKALALIMMVIGGAGLWRVIRHHPEAVEPSQTSMQRTSNSRLVAVLALIGGSLLFTHVHGVAPYANVAAGVYIAHVVLGAVALSIGATRIAQDKFPQWKRGLAIAFAGFMAVESVLLITYNEGLPWYIGYGRYNRWGPHGGTVAPYGNFRAELTIDQKAGVADVYVLDRFKDEPFDAWVWDGHPPQLVLGQGYHETALPLEIVEGRDNSEAGVCLVSHLRGSAAFLKTADTLSARLALEEPDYETGGNTLPRMGYFDPWVTSLISPVPPNEVALYQCPMHEGVHSQKPGVCPLCGMELVSLQQTPRPAGVLHDPGYGLNLKVDPTGSDPLSALFSMRVEKDGAGTVKLAPVHGQLVHLIVASADLSYFDHVHPVETAPGSGQFEIRYPFPRPGAYVLFADVTPVGERNQVFRAVVNVTASGVHQADDAFGLMAMEPEASMSKLVNPVALGATPQTPAPLDKNAAARGPAGEAIMVTLMPQMRTLYAGLHSELLFHLADSQGKPVTDLGKYIGAMGHCVAISEDTRTFLHSHPEQLIMPTDDDRGGPDVAFHVIFPAPGRYRVWGQFRRVGAGQNGRDELVIADFVVEVHQPWVPAKIVNFLVN